MFNGGKVTPPELPEKEEVVIGKDIPMRVFTMPEELRGRAATFVEQPKKEAPEALQPIVIPVPVPAEAPTVPRKKRISPALIVLLVFVLMIGTGAGVWWYVVTYASPPQTPYTPPSTPDPDPDPEPEPEPEPEEPYPGTDTDSDGLTNIEELLYGTDFRSPDTDGDTFLDGNEVFHRYDPNGLAPSTLLDTGAVRVLERADLPFTLYYPASWSVSAASAVDPGVTFRSEESGSITLVYEEKDMLTGLSEWMKESGISAKGIEETMTKEGYQARSAEDGRTVYLDLGAWVVSATYNLGETMSIEFLQTFKMMMNSVDVIADGNEGTSLGNGGNEGIEGGEGEDLESSEVTGGTDIEATLSETSGEGEGAQ